MTVLATAPDAPFAVAVDATHVYWTSYVGGTVSKVKRSGREPVILAKALGGPKGIAVGETFVYVAAFDAGQLVRIAK